MFLLYWITEILHTSSYRIKLVTHAITKNSDTNKSLQQAKTCIRKFDFVNGLYCIFVLYIPTSNTRTLVFLYD